MARDELIRKYRPILRMWINTYIQDTGFGYLRDDCLSEADLQIILLIDKFLEKNKRFSEHFHLLLRVIGRNIVVSAHRAEVRQLPHDGQTPPPDRFFSPLQDDPELEDSPIHYRLMKSCRDSRDGLIIGLMVAGYTRREVAEYLNVSVSQVRRRIRQIEKRFDKLEK